MMFYLTAALAALLIWTAQACSRPAPNAEAAKSAPPAAAPAGAAAKVDLDKIFPGGPGRELALSNCTTCHTFVPIVVLRMSQDAWARNSRDHRDRVKALSDAEFKVLYEYLAANFGPDKPVPKLPDELMQTWTTY